MKSWFVQFFLMSSLVCLVFSNAASAQQLKPTKYEPKYTVRVEKSVMVPMRDGVRLSTDMYMPESAPPRLPAILMRTPYNKSASTNWNFPDKESVAYYFASHGYVVLVQDVRGRYESEGAYEVSSADSEDGYDATTWAATQPWSSGKVGTYGCSYLGENQIETAKLRNPNLTAMIPQADGGSDRYFGLINGGAIELAVGFGWMRSQGSKVFPRFQLEVPQAQRVLAARYFDLTPALPKINFQQAWRVLPLMDMVDLAGAPPNDWKNFVTHSPTDPWWDHFGYVKPQHRFNAPALSVNSWYDIAVGDTLKIFNQMRTNADSPTAGENQFAIISPTSHCLSELATEHTMVGQLDLGDALLGYYEIYLNWFDHWLKAQGNDVTKMPKLRIYVMGKNEWRGENEWPLARTRFTKYYLHSDGHANSRFGTGTLTTEEPGGEPDDEFTYDPKTPVPSVGGPLCCTGTEDAVPGAYDQSEVEAREDVLVYTSPVLEGGIEVTGPLQVVLKVSSSAPDTDFTAKLVDVHSDGRAFNLQDGILRARYRNGYDKPAMMKEGAVYEVAIDLQATSNYFGKGHRIRLEISSSNFPRFDRNLNTGGDNYSETKWITARNIVHHTKTELSYVLLPVIP